MKKLTVKEEKFAQLVVELGNQSEAYRQAYDVSDLTADWIVVKASQLASKDNISIRIAELKEELAKANKMTKQRLIDYHLRIVEAWEELWKLGKKDNKTKEETQRFYLCKELVKGSDYRGSLEAIAKLTGLNEPDKTEQTIRSIEIIEKKRE